MTILGGFGFRQGSRHYEFALSHRDEEVKPDRDEYQLQIRSEANDGTKEEFDLNITVDRERELLELEHGGESRSVPLNLEPAGGDEIPEWEKILALFSEEDPIEKIIEAFPPIDPVIGCIIRGAASATVGQFIRCWPQCRNIDNFRERAHELARCLGSNFWRIIGTAMFRIGKCVIRYGL